MSASVTKHVVPVMISVSDDFTADHYVIPAPSVVNSQRSALSTALNALSTTTKVLILTVMAAIIFAVPALSGFLAYHIASENSNLTIISTQDVPSAADGRTNVVPQSLIK